MDFPAHDRLAQLRLESHYASYRKFVAGAAVVGYLLTALYAIVVLMSQSSAFGIAGLVGGVATCIGIYLTSQAALILADIADALMSRNAQRSDA